MILRVPWNTDDMDHLRRIVDSCDDDVKDAPAILSRAFDALNCVKHVHQLSRAQRHWVLCRTVETDVEITCDDVRQGSSISGPRAKSGPRRPNYWPAEQRQNAEEIAYIFFKTHFSVFTIYILIIIFIISLMKILVKF